METRPLIAVTIVAGIEERHSAAALLLELIGEFTEQSLDLSLVTLQTFRMESNIHGDTLSPDMLAGVLPILEETVEENCLDSLGIESGRRAHFSPHDVEFETGSA